MLLKIATGMLLAGCATFASAQDHASDLKSTGMSFQLDSNQIYLSSPVVKKSGIAQSGKNHTFIKQYGATLSFPVKHKKVSFDLGLNFRFYDSNEISQSALRNSSSFGLELNKLPIPMVYATALFELPFEGLTASVSGSHRNLGEQRFADYDLKAKVSYEWKNGLGLEGGWQHQQMNLEQSNDSEAFQMDSLFMDMKLKF